MENTNTKQDQRALADLCDFINAEWDEDIERGVETVEARIDRWANHAQLEQQQGENHE